MDIRLIRLNLENFKCHKSLSVDFGRKNTGIYGDNASGKTSVYDALTWLLFGKDSHGNGDKNFEVKPLNRDGSVMDHQAVTEVEAVLTADGDEITLKRTYQEVWTTKRGSAEATYDGNTSEYYVNGVPVKANAFKAKVSELVDEERFRLLTTVMYFPDMLPWQKRREALFDLFGAMSDREIMATEDRFQPLADAMGKMTLEDLRKIVTQKRKGLTSARNEIPARISECENTISDLGKLDFDGAAAQEAILTERLNSLNTEMLAIENNTAVKSKQLELQEAGMALRKLEQENLRFREKQLAGTTDPDAIESEIQMQARTLAAMERGIGAYQDTIARLDQEICDARQEWIQVNREVFSGSTECPTCGQPLPEKFLNKAVELFETSKARRLNDLVVRANRLKEGVARNREEYDKAMDRTRAAKDDIQSLLDKKAEAKKARENLVMDMPGFHGEKEQIEEDIRRLEDSLGKLKQDAYGAAAGLKSRIAEVRAEMDRVRGIAGKRSAYEYAQERIETLRSDAQAAAAALSEQDRLLYLMEEYSRYKAGFVEGRFNEKFRLARFRLFREQANGGIEERCDVVYDGVPYSGLNNGMKINVGIDIINTLSRAYGVTVPLFIDNAESVTALEKTDCQTVRLVVSEKDKELRIEHEN